MSIDFNYFLEWATETFGEENIEVRGEEICINSPFVPDYKPDTGNHLFCNPTKGVYHCWKSEAKGTLYNLVCRMTGCSYPEAKNILGSDMALYNWEKKLEEFFANKNKKITPAPPPKKLSLALPKDTYLISSLNPENKYRAMAEEYLYKRCMPIDGLYICAFGQYANRIIIPYYGKEGELIYFNGRDITGKSGLRYMGPPKEIGIGKQDVIWMKKWPKDGETIYLTEGEFDAMSLCEAEYNGAACGGKNLSEKQGLLLHNYGIVICFDLDKYGQEALHKVGRFIRSNSGYCRKIAYVRPAKNFKDWNEMLIKIGKSALHLYVKTYEKPITANEIDIMRLNSF